MKSKKALLALTLAVAMVPVNAFAFEAQEVKKPKTSAEEAKPVTNEAGETVISYEAAVQLALKENSDLKDWAASLEITQDNLERAVIALDGLRPSPNTPAYEQDLADLNALSSVNDQQLQLKAARHQETLLKEQVEYTVLLNYNAWIQLNDSIALAEKNLELEKTNQSAAALKYQMGLISENEFTKAQNALQTAENKLANVKASKDATYRSLKNLLGVNYDFVVDYTPEFTPLEGTINVDTYVNQKMNTSNSLKIAEINVEGAQYDIDNYTFKGEGVRKQLEAKLESANRSLKDTKTSYENTLRKLCENIPLMEQEKAAKEASLKEAQDALDAGKISLELGLISQTQYDGLELAVEGAKAELLATICDHAEAMYQYSHPDMAGGMSGYTGGGSGTSGGGSSTSGGQEQKSR